MIHGQLPVAALWRARLARFLAVCNASGPGDEPARLREALSLFQHADVPESLHLDRMIDAGAFESAALTLIGGDAGYMLSRGGNGVCLASVCLPAGTEQHTCEAGSPALALLAATATALWHVAADDIAVNLDREAAWLN